MLLTFELSYCFILFMSFKFLCDSKSGRPLKKPSDRKGFSRLGHTASGDSPDCTGMLPNYTDLLPVFFYYFDSSLGVLDKNDLDESLNAFS